ncbi:bifunctional diguanylate cyclase/phosphodiesterase [Paucibacter sp. APW11]|uniref:Bifunctional diguanylate cyclase/phosphodiesterase n=1 Tax=Roseateles aquae TaxID=3077235 RepID=A0ABU3PIV8_9BURK|nr:bifunctional diguanylate cyclase/phosphodiesterase [Paucibacter sp. APW11]MDT9002053.1 bifunctional diguanylate cyclase/phosphodiesterase [Paucibacter sp. APW11]
MSHLVLISSCLQVLMGATLLVLWHIDRRYGYVRLWGWSALLLGVGLALGLGMAEPNMAGLRLKAQAFGASAAVMASLYLYMAGASQYRSRPWSARFWSITLAVVTLATALIGIQDMRWGIAAAAAVLALGNWLCAAWIGLHGRRSETALAACFIASGMVHVSGPLLDPMSRSPITHGSGLVVQTVLSLALIIVAVARAHREAAEQAERFTRLAEHSLQGLAVLREHRVLYANPAALQIFGYPTLAAARRADVVTELVEAEDREQALRRHAAVLADPDARIDWQGLRQTHDGRRLFLRSLSSHIDWDGKPAELLVMIDDTARQTALEALRRQALHDELTDLPNRNHAVEQLQRLSARGQPFALISADVDRFQLVNETLGHQVGDALLQAIAQRLRQGLTPGTQLARLGEDQFLLLIEQVATPEDAQAEVEHMLALMGTPLRVEGHELLVHLSAGVALYPQDGRDGTALLRAADAAMHRAKQIAGNASVFYDRGMNRAAEARLQAEQSLAQAIAAGEFVLDYQPKFSAGARRLCGFEALVRWQRPDGTRISPMDFVPAAERTGQIKRLGELILAIAIGQLCDWQRQFGELPTVAVNVSPLQFEDVDFAARLLRSLDEARLPHSAVEVEITESAAIGQLDRVLPQLRLLHEAGVLCSLDDFGTGQSSLTMLRKLPISTMKIDRSMVEPLPRPDAAAVLRATCALGQSLGLEIVAEGVETEEQASALEALGCTQLQGYYLGRPLPAAAATALLAAQSRADSMPTQPSSV